MNGREAKREACFRAAMVIENALSDGVEWLGSRYPDEKDQERVADALRDLVKELIRRGWRKDVTDAP